MVAVTTTIEQEFHEALTALDVAIFTARPGEARPGKDSEFDRPNRWQQSTAEGNTGRLAQHRHGHAVMGLMGGRVVGIDVDTKNGADPVKVQQMLDGIGCRIYADVITPSGGRHFYVPGHPDLPTIHAQAARDGLPDLPGVEIISYGANLFLPGTLRPKYDGAGYSIRVDDLAALADGDDPDSAEALAAWVAGHRAGTHELFPVSAPWTGDEPDPRQAAYLKAALSRMHERLSAMGKDSGRNVAVYNAAMACGNFIAGAGMDQDGAVTYLRDAATRNGLVAEDGEKSVTASINSGLRNGRAKPRAVPDPPNPPVEISNGQRIDTRTGEVLTTAAPVELSNDPADSDSEGAPAVTLFDLQVADESNKIRIREAARRLVDEENRGPAEPFDAGTLAEILARPAEPDARIDRLLPWEASALITAQRKTGKTIMQLNMARSLLTGEDFLGRFGVRPLSGDVAFLNFEVSGAQLARWADEVGIPSGRFYLVNLRGRRNPLIDPEDRQQLADTLRARGVETVFCDPFGRAYTGNSQNDAGEVQSFLMSLDLFVRAEVGAKDLILAAHAGWNGERTRGSSALEDWADVLVTLTRDDTEDGDGERYLRAVGRDVELDEDRLDFDQATRRLTLAGAGSRKQAGKQRKIVDLLPQVIKVIEDRPGIKKAELLHQLRAVTSGFQDSDVNKATRQAEADGFIRIESLGAGKATLHYPCQPLPTVASGSTPNTPATPAIGQGLGVAPEEVPIPDPTTGRGQPCQTCGNPVDKPGYIKCSACIPQLFATEGKTA